LSECTSSIPRRAGKGRSRNADCKIPGITDKNNRTSHGTRLRQSDAHYFHLRIQITEQDFRRGGSEGLTRLAADTGAPFSRSPAGPAAANSRTDGSSSEARCTAAF